MPQKYPAIGEDVSHLMSGDTPGIGEDVSHLFESESSRRMPRKPVSAEDFMSPELSAGEKAWRVLKAGGRAALSGFQALSDLQRGTLGGDIDALNRTTERAKNLVSSQVGEFGKAREAFATGRTGEGIGHALAGLVPVVGPAAAHVGEMAETDPYGALGEGAVLVGGALAPAVAPVAAEAAQAAGRGIAAAGRGVASAARSVGPVVGEIAKTGALEAGAHAIGLPPLVASGARVLLENSIRNARAAKAARASEAAQAAEVNPNAGGRLVKTKVLTNESALADALSELQAEPPPARITTPPQPDLPPGYEPRTTVPRVSAKRPVQTMRPSERPAPAHGPQGYFLRKPPAEAPEPVVPFGRPLTESDLPASWRGRTGQPLTKPNVTGKIDPAEVSAYLEETGLTAEEALDAVARDKRLAPNDRIRLMEALGRTRLRRANSTTAPKESSQVSESVPTFDKISNRIGQIMKRVSDADVPDVEWNALTSELSKLKKLQTELYPEELAARSKSADASAKAAYSRALSGGR